MTKNPFLNAIAASLYITLIANLMFFGTKNIPGPDNSPLAPIAFLSVFCFSAAIMVYLFGYQPFQLYFDGKKKAAVDLFLKTILSFGVITALLLAALFSGVSR